MSWIVETKTIKGKEAKAAWRKDGAAVRPYMTDGGNIKYRAIRPNGGMLMGENGYEKTFTSVTAAQKALDKA